MRTVIFLQNGHLGERERYEKNPTPNWPTGLFWMQPTDEHLIERYAVDREALTASEQQRVRNMLQTHETARELLVFFQQYYQELDQIREQAMLPQVEAFVDRLLRSASVIPLQPYASLDGQPFTTVLAARSLEGPWRFESVAMLAAPEEGVLVRIVCDNQAGPCKLYVISDAKEKRAHVLISFPELGLDLITDAHGRADFLMTPEQRAADWSGVTGVLRRPLYVALLSRDELKREAVLSPSSHTIRCRLEGSRLLISGTPTGEGRAPCSHVGVTAAGETLVLPFKDGVASAEWASWLEQITVRFYA